MRYSGQSEPQDTEPSCTEANLSAASVESKAAGNAGSDTDQAHWAGPQVGFGLPHTAPVDSLIRAFSIPPPSLNPFLSTIRLLL